MLQDLLSDDRCTVQLLEAIRRWICHQELARFKRDDFQKELNMLRTLNPAQELPRTLERVDLPQDTILSEPSGSRGQQRQPTRRPALPQRMPEPNRTALSARRRLNDAERAARQAQGGQPELRLLILPVCVESAQEINKQPGALALPVCERQCRCRQIK